MADKKYKDVPRHKCVIQYEDAFKKDFRKTISAALKEVSSEMIKIVSK